MAAENIGFLYNTKIPGLSDAADIQEALTLYHYGSLDYDTLNENSSEIVSASVAGHLKGLQDQVDDLGVRRSAGDYLAVEPTGIADGFLWVDSTTSGITAPEYVQAFYSLTAPTTNLVNGVLWIDKSDSLNKIYVWNSVTSEWDYVNDFSSLIEAKGDILVGGGSEAYDNLPVGQNGYVLTADDSQSLGLKWAQVPEVQAQEDLEIELIMGVY